MLQFAHSLTHEEALSRYGAMLSSHKRCLILLAHPGLLNHSGLPFVPIDHLLPVLESQVFESAGGPAVWTLLARFIDCPPPATLDDCGHLLIHACAEYVAADRRPAFPLLSRLGRFISVACASVGRDYDRFALPALHRTYSVLDSLIRNTSTGSVGTEPQHVQDKTLFASLMNIFRISGPWDR